ncbi:DNA methyltransferase [Cloacibacterium sp. TD35]|uniref:DNA methyltransferase n=1 Tax=Cloacibacterium sp. TD35 TaxID=2976818 RepID=UPI00237DB8EB|nr:DNA methyltransferase [Cloacibacterium sp. TD35]WDT67231.1 DNA methyltransferase [Cloacibacterium sp. TD35]
MNIKVMPKFSLVATNLLKTNSTLNSLYSTPENYEEIRENIREFGILTPLLISRNYEIISGNLRYQIALELNINEIPVVFIDVEECDKDILAVSSNQFRKKTLVEIATEIRFFEKYYSLKRGQRTDLDPQLKIVKEEKDAVLNKIGKYTVNKLKAIEKKVFLLYGNDIEKLNLELSKVDKNEITLNQLDIKLEEKLLKKNNEDKIPEFYELISDKACIYNKSCENMSEIPDGYIQTIMTSPPYFNMRDYGIGKNQLGLEKEKETYVYNLVELFEDAKRVLSNEGSLFVNINDCIIDGEYQSVPELFLCEMIKKGWKYIDQYQWIKPNSQYSTGKRSLRNFEPIYHFVKDIKNYYYDEEWLKDFIDENNTISVGTNLKAPKLISGIDFRDNIIKHNISNTVELRNKCLEKGFLMEHSATFPITLPLIFTLSTSNPGDTILDMFSGTSTTGEASLLTNRRYIGYELSPQFVMASEIRLSDYILENVA